MEQGLAMPAAGEDDIHGRCRQLEMALQHAQVMPWSLMHNGAHRVVMLKCTN